MTQFMKVVQLDSFMHGDYVHLECTLCHHAMCMQL